MEFIILLVQRAEHKLSKKGYDTKGTWLLVDGSIYTPCYTTQGTIYKYAHVSGI